MAGVAWPCVDVWPATHSHRLGQVSDKARSRQVLRKRARPPIPLASRRKKILAGAESYISIGDRAESSLKFRELTLEETSRWTLFDFNLGDRGAGPPLRKFVYFF